MALDWKQGALAEGLACYRRREFFAAHEHWECEWRRAAGPEKTFLQALIQVAAAFHHLQQGNAQGAESLLARALRRLSSYPAEFGGLTVETIRQDIAVWLMALKDGRPVLELLLPRIV